jgi:nucleotide-binding universal stress UspA family protein
MNLSTILVAIRHTGSAPLLRAAADLASRAKAELKALYIEDAEWFEASRFSFSRQVTGFTGEVLPFTEKNITEQARALGSRLKKMFTEMGEVMQIKYTYESVRGTIDNELIKAASGVDLLIIEKYGKTFGGSIVLGTAIRYLTDNGSMPVLIWGSGTEWPQQLIGICSTPEQSRQVVDWTVGLGDLLGRSSRLFWTAEEDISAEEWSGRLENIWNEDKNMSARIKQISERNAFANIESLQHHRNAVYVIQRDLLKGRGNEYVEVMPNTFLLL